MVSNIFSIYDSYLSNRNNFKKLQNHMSGIVYQGIDVGELGQRIRFHNLAKIKELEDINQKVLDIEN